MKHCFIATSKIYRPMPPLLSCPVVEQQNHLGAKKVKRLNIYPVLLAFLVHATDPENAQNTASASKNLYQYLFYAVTLLLFLQIANMLNV
jgi:hypothetical protein